jgi:hypothetical protein
LRPYRFFHQFIVTDDRGTAYRLDYTGGSGLGNREWQGALSLCPSPPQEIRWLDICPAPGEAPTRIDLDAQVHPPDIALAERTLSPGELFLDVVGARILASAAGLLTGSASGPVPPVGDGPGEMGDIIAALHAAGALSPSSRVPGQLAELCARLGVRDHDIAVPPSGDLPERWQSVLTRCRSRQQGPVLAVGSWAAATVELPELDGVRIAILGLHQGERGTIVHVQASGVTAEDYWAYYRGVRPLPVLWVRDSAGFWHLTCTDGISRLDGDSEEILQLGIVPPLEADVPWIDVVAAGQSAQVRGRLSLRWEREPPYGMDSGYSS